MEEPKNSVQLPEIKLCAGQTKAGLPCRRRPIVGGVFCVDHMGYSKLTQGAPHGNVNHLKHGFYHAILDDQESADLADLIDQNDLSGEIGLIRTLVRRITKYLTDSKNEFTPKDIAIVAQLAFQGTRTIAHLVARNNGGASFTDILEEALGEMDFGDDD